MAPLTGTMHTGSVAQSQLAIDLHKQILLNEPDKVPFTVFSRFTKNGQFRERAIREEFYWHNDQLWNRWSAIDNAGGYAAGATTLKVQDASRFTKSDVVKVPRTGEIMRVTDTDELNNEIDVVRGIGSTAAAALLDEDELLIYSTAFEEGTLPRVSRSENPEKVTNYTQIFRRTLESTGTERSISNLSTPHNWDHQWRKVYLEHHKDIELAALFGEPGVKTGPEGKAVRTTGGLLHYMTQNNLDAGGAWTLPEIGAWIEQITRYGSNKKVLFCGRRVASVLSAHSLNRLQTSVGDETFGVRIKHWLDANGELQIVSHPLLEGDVYGGVAIAVDFKAQAIRYKYLAGDGPGGSRDTHVRANVQEPGRDGRADEILAECGFQIGLPETGGVVTGVTSAA